MSAAIVVAAVLVLAGCGWLGDDELSSPAVGTTDMACPIAIPAVALEDLDELELVSARASRAMQTSGAVESVTVSIAHSGTDTISVSSCSMTEERSDAERRVTADSWQETDPNILVEHVGVGFCVREGSNSTCVSGEDHQEVEQIVASSLFLTSTQWEALLVRWSDRYFGPDGPSEYPWLDGGLFDVVGADHYWLWGSDTEQCVTPHLSVVVDAAGDVEHDGLCMTNMAPGSELPEIEPTVVMLPASDFADQFRALLAEIR